ncbi:MAG: hypothetical protein ACKOAI_03505, partial [Acidimicrobiia bacterium]
LGVSIRSRASVSNHRLPDSFDRDDANVVSRDSQQPDRGAQRPLRDIRPSAHTPGTLLTRQASRA